MLVLWKRLFVLAICFILLAGCADQANPTVPNNTTTPTEEKIMNDYSGLGFGNWCGMNEWLLICSWDFSDPDNATITAMDSYSVLVFNNSYIECREFNTDWGKGHFTGDILDGYLEDAYPYDIVSKYVLQIQSYPKPNIEIKDLIIEAGLPVIRLSCERFFSDGYYFPTFFIDWTRSPIIEGDKITYYLLPEYVWE